MWTKQKPRSNRERFILPLLTFAVLGYFSYHIYHGEYGLYSRQKVEERINQLHTELDQLTSERFLLQKKVELLKEGSIEKDMLDEHARRKLNLSRSNELTILMTKGASSN